jgi:hypothetical protein
MDERRRALLHGDEHARAGRAPGDRDGDRRRSRREQIRAAAGEKLPLPDTRPWSFRGHAIECRINAEDPRSFAPWPGLITEYHPPGGGGVRVDSGVYGGSACPERLRLAARQGHHARPTRPRPSRACARARRVHHRRHPHEHPAASDLYTRKGQKAEATQTYGRVAQTYAEQGFFLKAVAVYKQILKLDPDIIEVQLRLGEMYEQLALISDALSTYEQVAATYAKLSNVEKSLETLKRMVDLDGENIPVRIKYAESLSKAGQG